MKNKSLLKKFLSFSIGGYISLIIGFFTTPVVTRMLSPEQYGIFSIMTLAVNMLLLGTTLGLDQGFVRYFYEEKEETRGKLLFNAIKYPLIIFCIISVIILIIRKRISDIVYGSYDLNMIITLIIMLLFSLLNRFSLLIIRMQQRAKLFSFFQILTQIINFSLIIVLFKVYGNNYKTLVISSTMCMVIVTLFSIIVERKIWMFGGKNEKVNSKELIKYSIPLSLTMALTWIFQSFDKIAIKTYSDMTELGLYAAAFKIVALLNIIQTGFTTFWTPVAYEKYAANKEETNFFERVHQYMCFFMFIVAAGILMCKDLVIILLGEKFSAASSIVPALVMMPIMYTISETTVLGINFKKKTKYHLIISVAVALFNVAGNILLVPKYGAKGAAISTGLAYILFFSLRTYFSLKFVEYRFNLKKFYLITFLIMSYAVYLTFNNNLKNTLFLGMGIISIILLTYIGMLKELFKKLNKNEVENGKKI